MDELNSSLYICCENNDIASIRILLENNANPNVCILLACYQGYYDTVKLLLEFGANPNFHGQGLGLSYPLFEAVCSNRIDIVGLLLYYKAYVRAELLMVAARKNSTDMVTLLLKYVPKHANRNAALREACKNRNRDMVKILLEYGANPQAQESMAFKIALSSGYTDIATILYTWVPKPIPNNYIRV